jgi:hypothetical protein
MLRRLSRDLWKFSVSNRAEVTCTTTDLSLFEPIFGTFGISGHRICA